MRLISVFVPFLLMTPAAFSASKPLFYNGTESFRVLDTKSETPVIRILDSSLTKRSFAMVVNSVLGFTKMSSKPKPYVELHLEKLYLLPSKEAPDKVDIQMLISGSKFDLEPTLSQKQLKEGKDIFVQVPERSQKLASFSVSHGGRFKVRYNSAQETLYIQEALAQIELSNPLSSKESEKVSFVGKAVRINPTNNPTKPQ